MSNRRTIVLRTTALFLLFTILFEVAFPSVSYALTSGPTTPEVYGHQPADATDNVSPVTGDFNYTIPITSIPEYPMAIGYHSQATMDQDPGIFGYGINGFTGSIARSTQGLPDDLAGGQRTYQYDNQHNWRGMLWATTGGSGGMTGYDNFKGVLKGRALDIAHFDFRDYDIPLYIGINGSATSETDAEVGVSATVFTSSNPRGNYGSATIYWGSSGLSGSVGMKYGNFTGSISGRSLKDLNTSVGFFGVGGSTHLNSFIGYMGITNFSTQTHTATSMLSPLASLIGTSRSNGGSASFPINIVDFDASFFINRYGNLNETKDAYGFMYLKDYDRGKREHIGDFTIEGEIPFDKKFRNSPVYLQRDFFMINAQGFSGSMQLYQEKHGVVSRNYARYQKFMGNNLGANKERREVEPWLGASRANFNKQVDILNIIKNGDKEDNDFDKEVFVEKELKSLTTDEYKFKDKAKFKLRGDLAGEFNLASVNGTDYEPNNYDLMHVQGTGGGLKLSFQMAEQQIPVYYPKAPTALEKKNNNAGTIKNSTNITYYTISDIVNTFPAATLDAVPTTNRKFAESYYTHHLKSSSAGRTAGESLIDSKLVDFNLLTNLKTLNTTKPYTGKLIADIRVKTAEGLQYIYNLPAFNKTSKSVQLSGKGVLPPVMAANDYVSFKDDISGANKYRRKVKETEDYMYPYAWMLTAIVGADYIDFDDVPGPSEGDLGYWVKFKYVKVADDYKWRFPFTSLDHNALVAEDIEDDVYSVSTGTKEIYYISEIESSGYVSKYQYAKRFDGLDAKNTDLYNGDAFNSLNQKEQLPSDPTGNNFQYAVHKVFLYKKHFEGENSSTRLIADKKGKLIRMTEFKYDYSLCPKTPNNLSNYTSVPISSAEYHINYTATNTAAIGTGKLTLRKIQHFSYEGEVAVALPSYELNYNSTGESNPEYDRKQIDQWGNYSKNAKTIIPNTGGAIKDGKGVAHANLPFYQSYTELSKEQADENSKVYKLSQVKLPSGGTLAVQYEAKAYGKVQDRVPYVMRNIKREIEYSFDDASKFHLLKVAVDVTDFRGTNKTLENLLRDGRNWQSEGTPIFGELSFYESNNASFPPREDEVYVVKEKAQIHLFDGTITTYNGRDYQNVYLRHYEKPKEKIPFISAYHNYIYSNSQKMVAIVETSNCNVGNSLEKYQTLERDNWFEAMKKLAYHQKKYHVENSTRRAKLEECFGKADNIVFAAQSFIRTPIFKGKYTGTRVKSLTFTDGFNYASKSDGSGQKTDENIYTTNFFYDDGKGNGVEAGVATIEPGGGESCVIDFKNTRGVGFYPAPGILQARTTIENAYTIPDENAAADQVVSRKKGKTVYEYYTANDPGLGFKDNFKINPVVREKGNISGMFLMHGVLTWLIVKVRLWPFKKKVTVKLPMYFPINCHWDRADNYHLQSYAYTDMTDIYGRPKMITQLSAAGNEINKVEYNYYGKNELVKSFDGSNGSLTNDPYATGGKDIKPGRMDQTWSEAYYTTENKGKVIPGIFLVKENTKRNFSFTNMKYTYLPPVLKEVKTSNSVDKSVSSVSYTGFDLYTGQPVESKTKDSYGNEKISRTVPAYWKYPKMGPSSLQQDNLNMLTSTTASYQYLNAVSNSNLLGVGITEWSQDKVQFVSTLRTTGKNYGAADFTYGYDLLSKDNLEMIYNTNGKSRPGFAVYPASMIKGTYIRDAKWTTKPVKTFSYETPLNADGTFTSFTPFVYGVDQAVTTGWKKVSENTLFDGNGRVVETKDVLEKFASAYVGYNFNYSTVTAGNSTFAGAAYEGAENTYKNASNAILLDDPRVTLGDATIVQSCVRTFISKTFFYANYVSTFKAKVLTICVPATPVHNVPFARVNASYTNAGKTLTRTFYISYNENEDFKIISEKGEAFKGFYVLQQSAQAGCSKKVKLAFENSVLSTLDAAFTNSGYTVSLADENLPQCAMPNIVYTLPGDECGGEAHTGKYAFMLRSNNRKGTRFEVDFSTLPAAEKRKYKAMVWVHNSSPKQTTLVAEGITGSTTTVLQTTSLNTPYLTAGNWSLLRLEVDPGIHTKLAFYVENKSSAGTAIYDDFRALPYQSTMENSVYEHKTGRVTATLDNENFATFYTYDGRGRLIEVKTEVENLGPQTIKKYVYNEQKNN